MKKHLIVGYVLFLAVAMFVFPVEGLPGSGVSSGASSGAEGIVLDLWPEGFLDENSSSRGVEQESKGDNITRLTNVEIPSMTIYRAEGDGSRPCVLVFPGGGFSILAMDLEGTEIAEWLNSRGITAAVLKYRVPLNREGAFEDSQRAMSLLRQRADSLGIDPGKIGVIGFSAGGSLAGTLCTNYEKRAYIPVDDVDKISCRPDFAMLVYPYLMAGRESDALAENIKVTSETPPAIMIHAQDDWVKAESSIYYFMALKKAGVPAELHVFPSGGHGYGLRRTEHSVTGWPELCNTWLETILKK